MPSAGRPASYIKRFEEDYRARPSYLTENYRSTGHIIAAANSVIEPANLRMKADHPITVNRSRARERLGGAWERMDPVTHGRVQILPTGDNPFSQAQVVLQELKRMASLDPAWEWSACAVVARNWDLLDPVRALCHSEEIPVQVSREDFTATWQLRETQALLDWTKRPGEPDEGRGPAAMAAPSSRRGRGMICSWRRWRYTGWRRTMKSCRRPPFENGWPSGPGTTVAGNAGSC